MNDDFGNLLNAIWLIHLRHWSTPTRTPFNPHRTFSIKSRGAHPLASWAAIKIIPKVEGAVFIAWESPGHVWIAGWSGWGQKERIIAARCRRLSPLAGRSHAPETPQKKNQKITFYKSIHKGRLFREVKTKNYKKKTMIVQYSCIFHPTYANKYPSSDFTVWYVLHCMPCQWKLDTLRGIGLKHLRAVLPPVSQCWGGNTRC